MNLVEGDFIPRRNLQPRTRVQDEHGSGQPPNPSRAIYSDKQRAVTRRRGGRGEEARREAGGGDGDKGGGRNPRLHDDGTIHSRFRLRAATRPDSREITCEFPRGAHSVKLAK